MYVSDLFQQTLPVGHVCKGTPPAAETVARLLPLFVPYEHFTICVQKVFVCVIGRSDTTVLMPVIIEMIV
jgi:hypothetical protein